MVWNELVLRFTSKIRDQKLVYANTKYQGYNQKKKNHEIFIPYKRE